MDYFRLSEIAKILKGRLQGNPDLRITGIRALNEAESGDVAVVFDVKAAAQIVKSRASAFVLPMQKGDVSAENSIRVDNPKNALIELLHLFYPKPEPTSMRHPKAVISETARLGSNVTVQACAVVEDHVQIGDGCTIHANVYIGQGSRIGGETEIFSNVTLYPGTVIGNRVRIHAGTVVGSDGFGYVAQNSGKQEKVPQVGRVVVEDDVEIGANCTIDRGTLGTTQIGAGTKIDNLVQIGHNSNIGRDCIIVAQTGISGSVQMGDHCVLAGQVGISDHVVLKPGTIVGAQSGVIHDIGPGKWVGYPAVPIIKALRAYHLLPELPEIRRRVRELEKRFPESICENE